MTFLSAIVEHFTRRADADEIQEYPCALGREYTDTELRKICGYMSEDVYFPIEIDRRDNPVLIENIPAYFSFAKDWEKKSAKVIQAHMREMSLSTRRNVNIKIRFVPQLFNEKLRKGISAEALILGVQKKKKCEVLIRVAIHNNKTYSTGVPMDEVGFMYRILHEISELDSLLTTSDPEDTMFGAKSEEESGRLLVSGDAVAYHELLDEKIADAKAEKTLSLFYTEEEIREARALDFFTQYARRLKTKSPT